MPEVHFHVRWPDGSEDRCYSPSTVLKNHFKAGDTMSLDEFVERSGVALTEASERVANKFGYYCSSASDQLAVIRAKAAQMPSGAPHQTVEILDIV